MGVPIVNNAPKNIHWLSKIFEDLVLRSRDLKEYSFGSEFVMNSNTKFPFLHFNPIESLVIYSDNKNSYDVVETVCEIVIADILRSDDENKVETISDVNEILLGLVAELSRHPYYRENKVKLIDNILMENELNKLDSKVNLVKCRLVFRYPFKRTYCSEPIEPLKDYTSFGSIFLSASQSLCELISECNISVGSQNLQKTLDIGNTFSGTIESINGNISNIDYIDFATASDIESRVGRLNWNESDGTIDLGLKGGNVTIQLGQESVSRVVNKTNNDLLESEYKVVRIRKESEGGSQGQRLGVLLAQADTENNSTDVLGLVTENILKNEEGFITTFGLVRGIDTTGDLQGENWLDGDILWLSPNVPGGLTKFRPNGGDHAIKIGYIEYSHKNNGKIFVKITDGIHLPYLCDVTLTSPQNGDLLYFTNSLWVNIPSSDLLIKGATGPTGPTGPAGSTGSIGPTGPAGSTIGIEDYHIINFSGESSFTGATAESIVYSQVITPSQWRGGTSSINVYEFNLLGQYQSGTTANAQFYVYLNTTNSVGGNLLFRGYMTSNNNATTFGGATLNINKKIWKDGVNFQTGLGSDNPVVANLSSFDLTNHNNASQLVNSDLNIDVTVNQFLIVTVLHPNTGVITRVKKLLLREV